MAYGALFLGWGAVKQGRERQSLMVFQELIQYLTDLQQRGEIEHFEPVALEPHGGDLAGFVLVRGAADKLARVRGSEELLRLTTRGNLVVNDLGVVGAVLGEDLNRLFNDYQQHAAELAGG
jgi:hypothetical protein